VTLLATARAAFLLAWQASAWRIVLRGVVTFVAALAPVVAIWFTKAVLDAVAAGRSVAPAVTGLVLCGVVIGASTPVMTYLAAELERHITLRARSRLFDAVGSLNGLARLEDPAFHNRLRLAESSGAQVPGDTAATLVTGAGALVSAAGFLVVLARVSWLMTAVVVAASLPAVAIELRMSRRRARMLWQVAPSERREIFYSQLLLDPQAAKELRLFGLTRFFGERMHSERRRANAQHRSVDRRELCTQGLLAIIASVVSGAGLLWAVSGAAHGRLSVGDVAVFIASIASLQATTGAIVGMLARLHHDLVMFEHFLAVERIEPDIADPVRVRILPPLRSGVELRDVWFRYAPDQPWVLRGVDLRIPAGAAVGVVGRNGGGKSTLVKLICRLYEPTHGSIVWDGVDLRDVPVAELRNRIGAVFQDFMAYDMTAAQNIGLGDLAAVGDSARIRFAAECAGVHDAVTALPGGYETLLSRIYLDDEQPDEQAGTYLSGGQWQKLATARAFMRADRDLLILDEPSSGLDATAEYELTNTLRELRRGRTSLLVSHRLGALRDADVIVTLDGGRVAEIGDHTSLTQRNGVYATMFRTQASGYQPDGKVRA
jgi:ATP-binding cassette subfamily B protein